MKRAVALSFLSMGLMLVNNTLFGMKIDKPVAGETSFYVCQPINIDWGTLWRNYCVIEAKRKGEDYFEVVAPNAFVESWDIVKSEGFIECEGPARELSFCEYVELIMSLQPKREYPKEYAKEKFMEAIEKNDFDTFKLFSKKLLDDSEKEYVNKEIVEQFYWVCRKHIEGVEDANKWNDSTYGMLQYLVKSCVGEKTLTLEKVIEEIEDNLYINRSKVVLMLKYFKEKEDGSAAE